jgi:hypothetical protein
MKKGNVTKKRLAGRRDSGMYRADRKSLERDKLTFKQRNQSSVR